MAPAQTLVMGILNVTPDSFADGGKHFEIDDIVRSGFVKDFIIAENQLGLY